MAATLERVMATHTDQKLELLKRTPLLAGLGRKEIEEVGRLAEEVDVAAGRVLMREGDTGREFYVVVSGTVGIDRGGTRIRTMEPGDFFGEIALLDEGPRTASATTDTAATLLVLGHREFHSLMDQFPAIRTCVLEALAKRIRNQQPEAAN
ncbi:MAG TPA: cyclic nucleotide-binding domain-containing protein [Candidatus Limnocylindrales bacterium]|nr:cyclic nucleotide-binding domain-containing protein [Candidatus Limnocylindrales bacterium]